MVTLTGYFLDCNKIALGIKNLKKKTNLTQIALDDAIVILGGGKNLYQQRPSQKDLLESYKSASPDKKCARVYSTKLLVTPEPMVVQYKE